MVVQTDGGWSWSRQGLPPVCRMTIPNPWSEGSLADFAGRVRFRRRFGRPRQVDSEERIWLRFAGVKGDAEVSLNLQILGKHEDSLGSFEFEITERLRERNELIVDVESREEDGGLYGDVVLEIRRTAYLRNVRAWVVRAGAAEFIHVAGDVVGSSSSMLELYVILGRSSVAYERIESVDGCKAFELVAEVGAPAHAAGPHEVRVELVGGAIVWYAVELGLSPGATD
ncbi:MAG TPA: hypothetical protein VK395_09915 [Gemmataceae bacterium]|nr:hypothetical protein [Gemmataceae bacterium]